jgi:sialidase-1
MYLMNVVGHCALLALCAVSAHTDATSTAATPSDLLDVYNSSMADSAGLTYACFRIPSLLRLPASGHLIAFAEGRRGSCADAGDVRIVSRRSADGGRSWGRVTQVVSEAGHTIGNPSPVADAKTGQLWLLYSRDNAQVLLTGSADGGATWGATPVNLTAALKPPNPDPKSWVATGPTGGVQLPSGRLVTAAYYNRYPDGSTRSYAVFSDDGGATWQRGADVGINSTPGAAVYMGGESQVVPFGGGEGLAMFIRARTTMATAARGGGSVGDVAHNHALAFSTDGGATWANSTRMSGIETVYCQGSIAATDGGDLLVSSPSTGNGVRANLLVWAARKAAPANFSQLEQLYSGSAAYSSMLSLQQPGAGGEYINVFERDNSQRISLARFQYP